MLERRIDVGLVYGCGHHPHAQHFGLVSHFSGNIEIPMVGPVLALHTVSRCACARVEE